MMPDSASEQNLSNEERRLLLRFARQSLERAARGTPLLEVDPADLPPRLLEPGVTFVTLTRGGALRGCVGGLEAYQTLVEDVVEHAAAAALQDYRFPQVRPEEVDQIEIEISRLTTPQPLEYSGPQELLAKVRPGIDGVLIVAGKQQRATFLPQVWEKLPNPVDFFDHLCAKLGAPEDLWRRQPLQVYTYQVEEFHEGQLNTAAE